MRSVSKGQERITAPLERLGWEQAWRWGRGCLGALPQGSEDPSGKGGAKLPGFPRPALHDRAELGEAQTEALPLDLGKP